MYQWGKVDHLSRQAMSSYAKFFILCDEIFLVKLVKSQRVEIDHSLTRPWESLILYKDSHRGSDGRRKTHSVGQNRAVPLACIVIWRKPPRSDTLLRDNPVSLGFRGQNSPPFLAYSVSSSNLPGEASCRPTSEMRPPSCNPSSDRSCFSLLYRSNRDKQHWSLVK